ncbi:MAG: hypothetical protein E6I52_15455 [Chloroflexi bacterium]|nr:MAG: hypothetical protein E6I52_15455 [Chloroflexota bacterium]
MRGAEPMPLFRALALVAGAFLLLVHAAHAQGASPGAVVNSFEHAWGQHDLDVALAQLADDAVITLQDARTRRLTGRPQMRDFLERAGLHSAPTLTSARHLEGNVLTWSERTEGQGQVLSSSEVTVQPVVQDGKIQSMVYRPGTLVRGLDLSATEVTPESAVTAVAGLLLFGLGLLSLATARPHVRSGSRQRGRLLSHLRDWRPPSAARPATSGPSARR